MSTRFTRRHFLKTTGVAVAASSLGSIKPTLAFADAGIKPAARNDLIDTNITLGRWPFRRLPLDDTSKLVAKLRQHGVTQAWAGNFDALLTKDIAAANTQLATECRQHGRGLLVPFGCVNPKLPAWEEHLRQCHETHRMPGVRLHPNYHRYKLDDPAFAKLLTVAHERKLLVQIATSMEDERTQPSGHQVPHVDVKPLLSILKEQPASSIILLNWFRPVKMELVKQLAALGVSFDVATLENVGGVADLIQKLSPSRVLFGSHAPFFYFEAALLKLKESALTAETSLAVRVENARRLMADHM